MESDQKTDGLFDMVKQHPAIAKWTGTGIGGVCLLIIINKITGFIDEINLSNIVAWISKLKSLIQGESAIAIILITLIICIFIYNYKKLYDKGKFKKKFLDAFRDLMIHDNTISNINIKDKKDKTNISISINRNNMSNTKEKTNSNVIDFSPSVTNNSEVK